MDINLFYTDNGFDSVFPPLILLHGNGGNSSSFFYVCDYFKNKRRVITIDSRGHGRTEKGNKPFTLEQFADDVLSFMDEHKIPKATFVGYSDGGNIAMLFARKYPERTAGMVLNGANMFPEGLKDYCYIHMVKDFKKYKKLLKKHPYNENYKYEIDLLNLMLKEPDITPEDLHKMNIPALVLVGSKDVIKEEHSKLIADSLPNSRLSTVEGGHNIVKTNSLPYNMEIERFLQENGL